MPDSTALFEVIKKRHSLRSYDGKLLLAKDKAELTRRISGCLSNPFGAAVRLPLPAYDRASGQKLGTYGVIRGAELYIAGIVKAAPMDIEGLGYSMEKAVLEATAMGLGTCWLAGTYNRNDFKDAANLGNDERVIAVSPVGYPAERKTMLDTMMHSAAGSARRKSWGELFFKGTTAQQLTEQAAGEYRDALEAVRLAPSGSNGQPWRIIKAGDKFHFYRHAKPGSFAGRVDMGIAACHFELVAREAGLKGEWVFENPVMDSNGDTLAYLASWAAR